MCDCILCGLKTSRTMLQRDVMTPDHGSLIVSGVAVQSHTHTLTQLPIEHCMNNSCSHLLYKIPMQRTQLPFVLPQGELQMPSNYKQRHLNGSAQVTRTGPLYASTRPPITCAAAQLPARMPKSWKIQRTLCTWESPQHSRFLPECPIYDLTTDQMSAPPRREPHIRPEDWSFHSPKADTGFSENTSVKEHM